MTAFAIVKRATLLCTAALLVACAAPNRTQLPDGTYAYRIDCGGSARGLNYCLEKAGKSCGAAGYRIVDEFGTTVSSSVDLDDDPLALFKDWEGDRNSILIRCGT